MVRGRASVGVCLALLAGLATGCGGGPETTGEAALPPPAEPSAAPEPTRSATGRVVAVGSIAEGVVADPRTNLVAVGLREPFRLALLDGRTGKIRREVPLPGRLRHLQLQSAGGPVLVPVESADQLLKVELPDGTVGSRVGVGRFPHDATATASGTVVVGDELGGTVSVIDGDRVVHTFDDAVQPGGVASAGELVGMVDVRQNTLTVYDISRRQRVAEVSAGEGPTHVIADRRGQLVVVDTRGEALLLFQLTPRLELVSRLALPGGPYGVGYDSSRDRLWVTLTATNELVGLDISGRRLQVAERIATVRQPNTVGVDSSTGRVFVASPVEGALQIIEP